MNATTRKTHQPRCINEALPYISCHSRSLILALSPPPIIFLSPLPCLLENQFILPAVTTPYVLFQSISSRGRALSAASSLTFGASRRRKELLDLVVVAAHDPRIVGGEAVLLAAVVLLKELSTLLQHRFNLDTASLLPTHPAATNTLAFISNRKSNRNR